MPDRADLIGLLTPEQASKRYHSTPRLVIVALNVLSAEHNGYGLLDISSSKSVRLGEGDKYVYTRQARWEDWFGF